MTGSIGGRAESCVSPARSLTEGDHVESQIMQSNPLPWATLIVVGVPVAGAVIVATVAL